MSSIEEIMESQLSFWLGQKTTDTYYNEPKLDESTVEVVKIFCDILQQADEVFITSVDVVEEYVRLKHLKHEEIQNSLLIVACAVLMASKLVGSHPEIKILSIQNIIKKLVKEEVERNEVKSTELDVFLTVEKLPLNTTATDLIMFLDYCKHKLTLKVNIQALCLEILNTVYITRKQMYQQLKFIYMRSPEGRVVFQHLICNKLYIPCGILLCSLKITKFKSHLNLKKIVTSFTKVAGIHQDHLHLLAGIIYETIYC